MRAAGWIENHRVNRLLTSSCSTFRAFGPTPDALDRAPLNNGVKSYEWILLCVPQVRVDNAFSHE
ncbi:hypothetical protein DYI41_20790 [Marinobacter salarius]|nr:hypothetical protein [Marinobacter salarius]